MVKKKTDQKMVSVVLVNYWTKKKETNKKKRERKMNEMFSLWDDAEDRVVCPLLSKQNIIVLN